MAKYSKSICNKICERLANGESIQKITKRSDMPSQATVYNWLADERYKEFLEMYTRAREAQADRLFDECLDIADKAKADTVQESRLQVDVRKWMAAKLKPVKYGDKTTTEHTGANGGPVQIISLNGDDSL